MKVVILHQHFKTPQTGGALRSYYLAKALVDNGVDTVVITAHNEKDYKISNVEGIIVHHLPVAYENRFGFYRRVFSFYAFVFQAVKVASRLRDADVCYAISTPLTTGIAARIINWRYGIPYVFEVGDLWPDAPIQMGFVKNALLKRFLYRMERRIYQEALAIVALSEPIQEMIRAKISGKDVYVIPNMADTNFFRPVEKGAGLRENVRGKFVVSYIGALGVANGLHHLLECAAAVLKAGLPVHFFICGDGAMVGILKTRADELRLTNLTILPFRDRNGVRDLMDVTDANFISYAPVRILETGSPNKYFDGLAAGKITIVNFGGWVRAEIEQNACGVYVDPVDAGDFLRKVSIFLTNNGLVKTYGQAARRLAEEKYARTILGHRYCRLIQDLVKR